MSLLDEFAASEMGKAMALPKPPEKPPAPRDYEAEARHDRLHAFGSHVLDGLPIAPVASAEARKAQAEAEAEIAATRAEAEKAQGELLAARGELEGLARNLDAAVARAAQCAADERRGAIDAEMKRRGLEPNDPKRAKVVQKMSKRGLL